MSVKPVGTISNLQGRYEIKIVQVRPVFRRPYLTVACTLCDKPHDHRWRDGAAAWRYAQAHADLHRDRIGTFVGIQLHNHTTTRSITHG